MSTDRQLLTEILWDKYSDYKNDRINTKRFKYEELFPTIEELWSSDLFEVTVAGKSFEDREIYKVSWGQGSIPVLMWSQMHGNESTATRAFLDIVNFFNTSDELDPIRETILKSITIHFIPVLNPDGMQRFQRRTAQEIDLNRDAVRVQTPESMILREIREKTGAVFGFNLHDQKIYYGAGYSGEPAAISFLAPPFNADNEINEVRKRAMDLIVELNGLLQERIPGMVARYDDEYNARAFGDNIQKWGTSTILVESGGYPGDPEKEFIRKLNYYLLINGLHSIATGSHQQMNTQSYHEIPENKEVFFDLIIRNAAITIGGRLFKADLGIMREEIDYNEARNYYFKATVEDIGDLSMFYGFDEIDLNGMECKTGDLYPFEFETHYELSNYDMKKILNGGYTHVVVKDALKNEQFVKNPVNVLTDDSDIDESIKIGANADFVVRDGDKVMLVIVNGFPHYPGKEITIQNGMIY